MAPTRPEKCPKCGAESPCVDWCEVDNGVGVQTFDHEHECPTHGRFAFVADYGAVGQWPAVPVHVVFRDEPDEGAT